MTVEHTMQEGLGHINKIDNQELLFNDVDITIELPALDDHIVRESFTGTHLAQDKLKWSWNHWGQLQCSVKGYSIKGRTLKAMYKEFLYNKRLFVATKEKSIGEKWTVLYGTLYIGKSPTVKILMRGETIIGIFKKNTKITPTIKWYEKAVYGGKAGHFNKSHKTIDYRAEAPHDVYDRQQPEFTKEMELEEIREFMHSLKRRVLSNEEREIIAAIGSECDMMID